MKKVLIICPYFGKLPRDQINLWLKTCYYNKNIDFLIFTDDKYAFNFPSNVKPVYMSFSNLVNYIQSKFNFPISLSRPYKLCDYKPCYGFIFNDFIGKYDYWGHTDLSDSFFGNVEKLLFPLLEDNPDKVGFLGHLSLYRNCEDINKAFFDCDKLGFSINEILGTNKIMSFDECFGKHSINTIFLKTGRQIKRFDDYFFDIDIYKNSFQNYYIDCNNNHININEYAILEWDNGNLYKIYLKNGKIVRDELIYVHYQKRKINIGINIEKCSHFLFVPNKIINFKKISKKLIKKHTKNKFTRFSIYKNKFLNIIKRLNCFIILHMFLTIF